MSGLMKSKTLWWPLTPPGASQPTPEIKIIPPTSEAVTEPMEEEQEVEAMATEAEKTAREEALEKQRRRMRAGRKSTILTSPQGLLEPANVFKKSLLGQ